MEQANENLEINDDLRITRGGLYSAFPIPAYKILIAANKHVAKDVLLCLISHLGEHKRKAFPSITLIQKEAGRGRSGVIAGIRTLEEFGFVKKYQFNQPGKRKRNIYYLQDACWNNDRMNREALAYSSIVGRCGCGVIVRNGEIGLGATAFHHWGCGDIVHMYSTNSRKKFEIQKLENESNNGELLVK